MSVALKAAASFMQPGGYLFKKPTKPRLCVSGAKQCTAFGPSEEV